MAIVNSIQRIMIGFGNGTAYGTASGVALSGASTVTTITLATVNPLYTQGYTAGIIRVKIYNGGSSSTAAACTIQVTDGTNTYLIGTIGVATIANGANSGVDHLFYLNVDIQITAIILTTALTVGTTTATLDWEFDLQP